MKWELKIDLSRQLEWESHKVLCGEHRILYTDTFNQKHIDWPKYRHIYELVNPEVIALRATASTLPFCLHANYISGLSLFYYDNEKMKLRFNAYVWCIYLLHRHDEE